MGQNLFVTVNTHIREHNQEATDYDRRPWD